VIYGRHRAHRLVGFQNEFNHVIHRKHSKINTLQWSQCTISDFGRQSPERRGTEPAPLVDCQAWRMPFPGPESVTGESGLRAARGYRTARPRCLPGAGFIPRLETLYRYAGRFGSDAPRYGGSVPVAMATGAVLTSVGFVTFRQPTVNARTTWSVRPP
jgi:hypothetical protein